MSRNQPLRDLIAAFETALRDGSFVRLSLGNYGGTEPDLKGIHLRRILIKREEKLSFTWRYKTRDIVKNHGLPEALAMVTKALEKTSAPQPCLRPPSTCTGMAKPCVNPARPARTPLPRSMTAAKPG